MEPITHALASWVLSRAGLNRVTKPATAILLVSGTAADADWLTYLLGPGAFFAGHRTATHSIPGIFAVAAMVAAGFWLLGRRRERWRVGFRTAFLLAVAGATLHVVLDLADSCGARLLWPFGGWTAGAFFTTVDPWILLLLLAGLLLPMLFALVSAEIGARRKTPSGRQGAILVFGLLALYAGGRGLLRAQAVATLMARTYGSELPRRAGAWPEAVSPLTWHGIVETESALHEVDVPLAPGTSFNPEAGIAWFKPEPSPILDAAQATSTARAFLTAAQFPRATVMRTQEGYTVELRDLRFATLGERSRSVMAVVELDAQGRVVDEKFRYDRKAAR